MLAIFANCLNMGILLPFTGYATYRILATGSPVLSTRRAVAAGVGAYVGITVAAIAVGIELGIEPILFSQNGHALYSPYGLREAIPAMLAAGAATDADVSMLGVMKQSDEQSLDEAKSRTQDESRSGYVYKLIRTHVSHGESDAVVTTSTFSHDFTYRDLPALLRGFESQPVRTGMPKQVRIAQGAKPGFLVAIADLIHDSVYAFHHSGVSGLTRRTVAYVYYGRVYDMAIDAPRVLKGARYGNRTYPTLLSADFEVRNTTGGSKEQFSVVYGVDGAIEEVPIYIAYQPRWWFKAELLLDEGERF